MANNIDLTICALECPLGTFQCSAWLIQLRQRTALSPLKRSCFRFASLTLRTPHRSPVSLCFSPKRTTFRFASLTLRTARRNLLSEGSGVPHGLFCDSAPSPIRALVFRSAYSASRNAPASAAFAASIEAHCAVSSETLMLQPLRGLRTPHRPPVSSPLAAAAALWLPCVRGAVRRRAGLRGCLRVRGKGKGRRPSPVSAPNRLFKLLRCSGRLIRQAETLELQPHSRPPSKHTVLFLPKHSCFSRFAASEPRTALPFLLH